MASYRVHYCRADGTVFAAHDVEAAKDADAIARARALGTGRTSVFEVWQSDRLVHRSAPVGASPRVTAALRPLPRR